MPKVKQDHVVALKHLRKADPILKVVIDQAGPFTLKPQKDRFRMLVRSIIAQQISTSAARSIGKRLEDLAAPDGITPHSLARFDATKMRTAGISPQKAGYLIDLVARADDGRLNLKTIGRLNDEEVIEHLIQVKGVGRWTAQMFLIFSLGRLDVFPHDDLGIKTALKNLYAFADLPSKDDSHAIAEPWRPYATIGSWYLWRSLEFKKQAK